MTAWKATDLDKTEHKYLGILEFQDTSDEWHVFEIIETKDRILFGGSCNVGFLESGYLEKEDWETTDEALGELSCDLETYYRNGPDYVSRIVCNERM